ncbi:MAG: hypothetical protein ACE37H_04860 [Phycisphaeraceae bacterium]
MDAHDQVHPNSPRLGDLGLTDGDRYHLGRSAASLAEPVLEPRSEVACQVSDEDLYRFKKLLAALGLDRSEPLQAKLLKSLLNAGRTIARMRPEDIRAQIQHEAEVLEVARDRDQERQVTRGALYDAMARVRDERHQLGTQFGESPSHALEAASERLDRDMDWLREQLKGLC